MVTAAYELSSLWLGLQTALELLSNEHFEWGEVLVFEEGRELLGLAIVLSWCPLLCLLTRLLARWHWPLLPLGRHWRGAAFTRDETRYARVPLSASAGDVEDAVDAVGAVGAMVATDGGETGAAVRAREATVVTTGAQGVRACECCGCRHVSKWSIVLPLVGVGSLLALLPTLCWLYCFLPRTGEVHFCAQMRPLNHSASA